MMKLYVEVAFSVRLSWLNSSCLVMSPVQFFVNPSVEVVQLAKTGAARAVLESSTPITSGRVREDRGRKNTPPVSHVSRAALSWPA